MANGKILRQLIKAGASGDSNAFRRASEAVFKMNSRSSITCRLTTLSKRSGADIENG
jgi:hypothetical protein